jgi:hypothetical protein
MASPLQAAGRIAQLRDFLRGAAAAAELGEATAQALAGACTAWLDGALTLDRAFGVRPASGRDPRTELRHERRKRLLRDIAARFPGSDLKRADQLHERLSIYFGGRWRRDRLADRCPYAPDTVEAALWQTLKIEPAVLSGDRIRRLISGRELSLFVTNEPGEACGEAEAGD